MANEEREAVKPFGLTLTSPLSAEDRDAVWGLVCELAQAKEEVERLRARVFDLENVIGNAQAALGIADADPDC